MGRIDLKKKKLNSLALLFVCTEGGLWSRSRT